MNRNGAEYLATLFALELLMPEDKVREYCKAEKRVQKIAEHFDVEPRVAEERLFLLGYRLKNPIR